jgi:hypothetical protein
MFLFLKPRNCSEDVSSIVYGEKYFMKILYELNIFVCRKGDIFNGFFRISLMKIVIEIVS